MRTLVKLFVGTDDDNCVSVAIIKVVVGVAAVGNDDASRESDAPEFFVSNEPLLMLNDVSGAIWRCHRRLAVVVVVVVVVVVDIVVGVAVVGGLTPLQQVSGHESLTPVLRHVPPLQTHSHEIVQQ